jgi:hypothetical protein
MQLSIAHRIGQSHVEIVLRSDRRKLALRVEKIFHKCSFDGFYSQTGSIILNDYILAPRI